MPESGTYGSVRGALSNERPYRDPAFAGMTAEGEVIVRIAHHAAIIGEASHSAASDPALCAP